MPFQTGNSPYYKIEITLPGYGKTPRLSTRTERKSVARRMEECLRYLAEDGYHELLGALEPEGRGQGGKIDLPTLYHAWRKGELTALRRRVEDPLLREAVRTFARTLEYPNHRRGARHLLRITTEPGGPLLAGQKACTSWLYEAANVNTCTRHLIRTDGYKPNTVRNETYGFVSKFLRHRLGEADAQRVLVEVERPSEDDRRDVWLGANDLLRVVSASEWELRMFLLLSASTGIDKSPALRIRGRDVDFGGWTLFVRDNKAKGRRRTIDLAPVAVYVLQLLLEGKPPGEKAITLTKGQINYRWRKAREAAGLTKEGGFEKGVRLKDFRHTFAVHYLRGGGNIAGLSGRLGHTREAQSLMYARHEAKGTSDVERAAASMGLKLPDHLKDQLPTPEERAAEVPEMPEWWFDRQAPPRLPDEDGARILDITRRYQERGTAGYADDPKAYNKRWRERRKAEGS